MHIADGILSPEVCAVTAVAAAGAVGYSLYRLKDALADRTVPLTGMMAALVFAGQMVNFPIGAPVSGHLMGGVLAAVVVGPWAGCIAITLVLLVQCFLFSDGGVLPLGANILHMAVIGSMGGYAVYSAVARLVGGCNRGTVIGAVVASWLSVMAAAALFCVEFGISWNNPDFDMSRIFTLMVSFHSIIGVGEAFITGTVISFVLSQRPDLIYRPEGAATVVSGVGRFAMAGLVCALAIAAFMAPFASSHPDGLEAVAGKTGFEQLAGEPKVFFLPDYEVPLPFQGWQESALWSKLSVSLAGLLGTAAIFAISIAFGRGLKLGHAPVEPPHDQ